MVHQLINQFTGQIQTLMYLMMCINALLHLIFAGAVARDAGSFMSRGQQTVLVSPSIWAFATLLGGVFTATIYWLLHHSTITRPTIRETHYDKIPEY